MKEVMWFQMALLPIVHPLPAERKHLVLQKGI